MKIKAEATIDVFKLFVHDKWDTGCFDPYRVAHIINDALMSEGSLWRVEEPEGLDRFICYHVDYDERITERLYSVEAVKARLPDEVVEVLEALQKKAFKL